MAAALDGLKTGGFCCTIGQNSFLRIAKEATGKHASTESAGSRTQWRPVGDKSVSELSRAAVVLQQPDKAGGGAGGSKQVAQLGHTLAMLAKSARQPEDRVTRTQ